jgi:hypothetical protein
MTSNPNNMPVGMKDSASYTMNIEQKIEFARKNEKKEIFIQDMSLKKIPSK